MYIYWSLVKHTDDYRHRECHRDRDHMVIGSTTTHAIIACLWRGILDATLCDQAYQWLAAGLWFSQGTPVTPTNKTENHDITLEVQCSRL